MSNKLNTTQKIASDVVSTFIARADESSDVNQLAFDSIIKETLTTVGFGQCFEQLLVRKNFQLKAILDVFSKASRECVFDTYAALTSGIKRFHFPLYELYHRKALQNVKEESDCFRCSDCGYEWSMAAGDNEVPVRCTHD